MRGTVVAGVGTRHGASLPDGGVNQKKCMFATQIRTSPFIALSSPYINENSTNSQCAEMPATRPPTVCEAIALEISWR